MGWSAPVQSAKTIGALTKDFTSPVTSGNSIFVAVAQYQNGSAPDIPTVAGEGAVAFTQVGTRATASGSDNVRVTLFRLDNATGASNWTVTVSTTTATADVVFIQVEFSGGRVAGIADVENDLAGNSTAPSTSVTTTVANDLLLGAFTHTGSDRTLTSGSGFTVIQENEGGSTSMPLHLEYQIATTATAYTVDGTIGTGAVPWAIVGGAFKEEAGGGGLTAAQEAGIFDQQRSGSVIGRVDA